MEGCRSTPSETTCIFGMWWPNSSSPISRTRSFGIGRRTGEYSAKSAYMMLHAGSTTFLGHKLIWETWAPLKVKIFLWLAFKRRHWTGDRRRRHGLDAWELCYLCDQAEETIDHILASCPVTREVWFFALQAFGKQLPQTASSTFQWWRTLRRLFHGDQRPGLDSLFAIISWTIWKERNARCFRGAAAAISDLLQLIKGEADAWIEASARGLRALAGS